MKKDWLDSFNAAITVCDKDGIIKYMNEKAALQFSKYGGYELLGRSIFDCHSANSIQIIRNMLDSEQENVYITEKAGIKTLICQNPIYENKRFAGIMEVSIDLPAKLPHHIRD